MILWEHVSMLRCVVKMMLLMPFGLSVCPRGPVRCATGPWTQQLMASDISAHPFMKLWPPFEVCTPLVLRLKVIKEYIGRQEGSIFSVKTHLRFTPLISSPSVPCVGAHPLCNCVCLVVRTPFVVVQRLFAFFLDRSPLLAHFSLVEWPRPRNLFG